MHQHRAQDLVIATVQQKYKEIFEHILRLKYSKLVFLRALYFCGSMLPNLLVMAFFKIQAKNIF